MDINKIDKIDTNLVLPNIQYNLREIERDKWGNILNEQTFKTLNNNMKIMKEILLEIANENNVTNLDSIKLRLNNLETDRDSIESIVDNNTNGLINVGITERKLNLKGTELEFNGNKVDLDNIVYSNDLTNEINLLKQDVNKYIDEDELKLKTDILEQGISNSVLKSKYDRDMRDVVRNWGEPSFNSLSVSGETRLSGTTNVSNLNVENLKVQDGSHSFKFVSADVHSSLTLGSEWLPLNLIGRETLKYNNEEVALKKDIPVLTETEKLIKNDTNNNFTGENNFTNLKVNNNPVMSFKTLFEGKELIVYENGESVDEVGLATSISYARFVGAKEYNYVAITLESLKLGETPFSYGNMKYGVRQTYSKTIIIPKGKESIDLIFNNWEDIFIRVNDFSQEITLAFMNYDNSNPLCLTKVSIF